MHRLSKGGEQSRLVKWLDTSASCSCNTCGPSEPAPPPGKGKVVKIHERC